MEEKEALLRNEPRVALAQFKKQMKEKAVRSLASLKQPLDLNSTQYCGRALSEENDVFLDFNPVHQKVEFSRWFPTTTPDQNYHYFKPEKRDRRSEAENELKNEAKNEEKEDQYVRLAISLAEQGKPALVIRALDFMNDEFPHSKYRTEAKFLKANSLIKLGFTPEGERLLQDLSTETNERDISFQAALYLAYKNLERNSALSSLDQFLWLIHYFPHSKMAWVFHLGAAECLYSLRQAERALKEYQWVIENAPTSGDKSEAVYRMGDLFLLRHQYEQALASYSQALSYFKSESKRYPTFHLNRAESFYHLGHFEEAKAVFEAFLDDFPNDPKGWRASFRLGEIAARTMQTDGDLEKSRRWYYETINRYPTSPGVVLSRVRLAPCGDHGGLNFETQDQFFQNEARKFDGEGEDSARSLPGFPDSCTRKNGDIPGISESVPGRGDRGNFSCKESASQEGVDSYHE